MRAKLAELLIMSEMFASMPTYTATNPFRGGRTLPSNSKWRYSHKENVKRKRIKRIAANSKSINRKNK